MKPLKGEKTWAALVLIGWMLTALATWGVVVGGRRALAKEGCKLCDLSGKGIELEMADAATVETLLRKDGNGCGPAKCMRAGLLGAVLDDTILLVPAYVMLTFFLFALIGAGRGRMWVAAAGGLFAAAIGSADLWENCLQACILHSTANAAPSDDTLVLLRIAGQLKWWLLAISVLVIAGFWPRRRWRITLGIFALAAAGLLAVGLSCGALEESVRRVSYGAVAVFVFWTVATIAAVAVAIEPESSSGDAAAGGGQ